MVATGVAALGIAAGLYFALRGRGAASGRDSGPGSQAILDELLALERARAEGEVGPRTYEKARRELLDALAMALARA
jgi:hypothetical protein